MLHVSSIPSLGIGLLGRKLSPDGQKKRSPEGKNGDDLLQSPAIYEAESPDELALVHAARAYDIKLVKRTPRSAIVSFPDKSMLAFEILHVGILQRVTREKVSGIWNSFHLFRDRLQVLPFDSNRKCMSVLLKHPHTGEIILYSKGADTTMLPALSASDENVVASRSIQQYLQSYARQGLRTLVMARRTLTLQEYEAWRQKHDEAELATENRERRIRDSYATLESHLTLLGATGIEDKLQTGVPETMAALVAAGIVVWVLTGLQRITSLRWLMHKPV